MATCLITTLKESVDDTSIMKLGEFEIKIRNNTTSPDKLTLGIANLNEGLYLEIIGEGHFTNSDGSANLGKVNHISVSEVDVWISPGNYKVRVKSKYNLIKLIFISSVSRQNHIDVDIDIFKYANAGYNTLKFSAFNNIYGDISVLKDKEYMASVSMSGSNVEGDIVAFSNKPNLRIVEMWKCHKGVYGNIAVFSDATNMTSINISETDVEGNISSLGNKTMLDTLHLDSTNVTGNLASLAGFTALKSLNVSNTAITGDTSSLRNLTNLTTFTYTNTAITGNWPLT